MVKRDIFFVKVNAGRFTKRKHLKWKYLFPIKPLVRKWVFQFESYNKIISTQEPANLCRKY